MGSQPRRGRNLSRAERCRGAARTALAPPGRSRRAPRAPRRSCPGAISCPYATAQVIGNRAQGVLRFPEAVAVDAQGDVFVADQLSYVVQKFSAGGALETEWGSYGAAPRTVRADRRHRHRTPQETSTSSTPVTTASRSSTSNGNFLTSWGHHGSELGEFSFGSSQNYTQPPGGGIAVAGDYVYVADSGNNRIERFNLTGGEAMAWGEKGSGLGQFSYPRGVAANESEVIVSDDDNHRVQKFAPKARSSQRPAATGLDPASSATPTGSPSTPPATYMWPTTSTTAW